MTFFDFIIESSLVKVIIVSRVQLKALKNSTITNVCFMVQMSNCFEAMAKTWNNLPIDGANANERIGSVQIILWGILMLLRLSTNSNRANLSELVFDSSDPIASKMGRLKQVLQLHELHELMLVFISGLTIDQAFELKMSAHSYTFQSKFSFICYFSPNKKKFKYISPTSDFSILWANSQLKAEKFGRKFKIRYGRSRVGQGGRSFHPSTLRELARAVAGLFVNPHDPVASDRY